MVLFSFNSICNQTHTFVLQKTANSERGATFTEYLFLVFLAAFGFLAAHKLFIDIMQDQGAEIAYCIEFGGGTVGSTTTAPTDKEFKRMKKLGKLCGLNQGQFTFDNCVGDGSCGEPAS